MSITARIIGVIRAGIILPALRQILIDTFWPVIKRRLGGKTMFKIIDITPGKVIQAAHDKFVGKTGGTLIKASLPITADQLAVIVLELKKLGYLYGRDYLCESTD